VTQGLALSSFALPAEEDKLFDGASLTEHALRRRSNQVRFLDGVGFSSSGGEHGQGYGHGFKKVDVKDWFFSCHFWCDPVMPGSLGVEAMHQTLELFCVQNGLAAGVASPTFSHDLGTTKWKYRGQLTPKAKRCDVEVHITKVDRDGGGVTVVADGYLYVDALRVYHAIGLRTHLGPAGAAPQPAASAASAPALSLASTPTAAPAAPPVAAQKLTAAQKYALYKARQKS